ncbi:Yos1-like protein [Macrolepiota fuliginosa MF-IS2]|uniref:Yos1-like protein n=1 Tax=Macrolepiota fuliginosa MF-IS2 TaxID=1400762 RepID=A0A9P6C4E8_9AGAR|nr:Yos1-like protein [Macrolepiota fuliginosa MF-IS2]
MFGTLIQVSLLFINAIAILNEERFLARIGWVSVTPAQTQSAYNQGYDQAGYGNQDIGVKTRLIDLISAVRTLMRIPLIIINIVVILYELVWG